MPNVTKCRRVYADYVESGKKGVREGEGIEKGKNRCDKRLIWFV